MDAHEFRELLFDCLEWDKNTDDDHWGWGWIASILNHNDVSNIKVADSNEHSDGNWHTDLYVVFAVESEDGVQYFKKTGYHQSHEGAYWDGDIVEVFPETKTVTVWVDECSTLSEYDSFDSYY